jgi:glucose-6-phosphate 1-dehydrogenase
VITIQPREIIHIGFGVKRPGTKICIDPVIMDYEYEKLRGLDAYQWVLHDCMLDDQFLFPDQRSVELTWSILTPVLRMLESEAHGESLPLYSAGSPGPEAASALIEKDGRAWRPL